MSKITLFLLFIGIFGQLSAQNISFKKYEYVGTGASQHYQYLPMLAGKQVGVVTNHTGIIQKSKNSQGFRPRTWVPRHR